MLVRFTLVLLAATAAASSPVVAAARPRLPCRRLPHQPAQSCLSLRGGSAGGAAAFVGDYTKASVLGTVVSRGGWLAVFLLSLSLTSLVMSRFEHTLEREIQLAYFVPLLIGHGGNAGGQTIGAVLSALSQGQLQLHDWVRTRERRR